MMNKTDVTTMILDKKRTAGIKWEKIAADIGMSEVFTASACLGMNSLPRDKADLLVRNLGLPQEAAVVLAEPPNKKFDRDTPTDPCIYRLYEIAGVYGETIKELIHEKFGDGIMSAIDFDLAVARIPHPKGDRVEIRMSGKYLAYNQW